MRNNSRSLLILILMTLSICLVNSCAPISDIWPTPTSPHTLQNINGLKVLWSLTNIYTQQDYFNPMMVAGSGNLVFLGSVTRTVALNTICMNGLDGKISWIEYEQKLGSEQKKEKLGSPGFVTIYTNGLYIVYGGFPEVDKYDFCTGQELWVQNLSGKGGEVQHADHFSNRGFL